MARSILVVDDSPTIRHLLRNIIRELGYEVTEAAGGRAGVAVARTKAFDLIITDLNMPEGDGFTLVREVRGLSGYAATPIIILTTESKETEVARGKLVGATAWIVKPFERDTLRKVLGDVLGA